MRTLTFVHRTIVAGTVLCTAAPLFAAGTLVPEQFHGMWQSVAEGDAPSCKTNDADAMITVKPDRVDFHEGGCDILGIDVTSSGAGTLSLDLMCGGEGEIWPSRQVWKSTTNAGAPALEVTDHRGDGDYTYLYAQCPVLSPSVQADSRSYCYSDGEFSTLKITSLSEDKLEFSVESAQSNAHICGLEGVADVIDGGARYTERLDDGSQCTLDILFSPDMSVRFEDKDEICKRNFCGMRAYFDRIEFSGTSGHPC